jgi:hypothetical protein
MVSSASVTLAGWSSGSPNRTAIARRLAVRREFRQQLQRARQVNQVGFAGIVEQAPEGVLGQTESADVDGVLGDRIELRCVAAKPTLMRQRVGDVLDQDLGGIWAQRPKPQAGEGANEAVETIHTVSGTRLTAPHNSLEGSGARSSIGLSTGAGGLGEAKGF